MLTCPHCGTGVEHGRSVCIGCHAEVRYGATGRQVFGLWIVAFVALYTALMEYGPRFLQKIPLAGGEALIALTLGAYLVARWVAKILFGRRVLFLRSYRHLR